MRMGPLAEGSLGWRAMCSVKARWAVCELSGTGEGAACKMVPRASGHILQGIAAACAPSTCTFRPFPIPTVPQH